MDVVNLVYILLSPCNTTFFFPYIYLEVILEQWKHKEITNFTLSSIISCACIMYACGRQGQLGSINNAIRTIN